MNRRGFLRRTSAAGVAGAAGLAGCLERLGFEEESAWRDPPLVDDRPDAVYVPASTEGMGAYGSASDGEYAAALSYTFPHRFWTVTGGDRNRVTVGTDDTMHLMCTVWDPETDVVLPVEMNVEIEAEDGIVRQFSPWPMLSQRMGFHYGDNVQLPGEGAYTARIRVGPVQSRRTGAFAGRFESAGTLEIDFEYERPDVHDLPYEPVANDRRGTRGALEPVDRGGHGGGEGGHGGEGGAGSDEGNGETSRDEAEAPGPAPPTRGPPIDDLPGRHLGTDRTGDATLSILETDLDRLIGDENAALAAFLRTPHNDVPLPFTDLRATVERDGEVRREASLRETLDHELGHHYGTSGDPLESGDRLTVSVRTPPAVSRHDGYETAFFDFDDVTVDV